jgi:LacI family transcriptional regulator
MGTEAARLILNWRPGRRIIKIPPTGVMERDSVRPQTPPDPLVSLAIEHLRASAGKPVRVRDLQKLTGLSPQMLVYRFRNAIGRSPMEEILRHRINNAKHLLGETDLPVVTIAGQCGFNNANCFYVAFRNVAGMSPREYRAQFGP